MTSGATKWWTSYESLDLAARVKIVISLWLLLTRDSVYVGTYVPTYTVQTYMTTHRYVALLSYVASVLFVRDGVAIILSRKQEMTRPKNSL